MHAGQKNIHSRDIIHVRFASGTLARNPLAPVSERVLARQQDTMRIRKLVQHGSNLECEEVTCRRLNEGLERLSIRQLACMPCVRIGIATHAI
jgi:hypothetical protein